MCKHWSGRLVCLTLQAGGPWPKLNCMQTKIVSYEFLWEIRDATPFCGCLALSSFSNFSLTFCHPSAVPYLVIIRYFKVGLIVTDHLRVLFPGAKFFHAVGHSLNPVTILSLDWVLDVHYYINCHSILSVTSFAKRMNGIAILWILKTEGHPNWHMETIEMCPGLKRWVFEAAIVGQTSSVNIVFIGKNTLTKFSISRAISFRDLRFHKKNWTRFLAVENKYNRLESCLFTFYQN